MHRDIQGREALLFNALPIGSTQVGEGEIGAVEKAEPVVVVLEIEASALPRRLLIDETEGAVVVALLKAVEQGFGETEPQAFIEILLQLHYMEGAIGIFHLQGELLFPHQELQIDQIAGAFAVDAEQAIPRLKPQLFPDRASFNRCHHRWCGKARGISFGRRQGNACRGFLPHRPLGIKGFFCFRPEWP